MRKKKNNNKIINIIIIIGIIFLLASLILMLVRNKEIPNHIVEINYEKYAEIIKKDENNIILLTSPTCTHCNNYKPYANYVADDYDLVIYDLNLNTLTYEQYIEIHDKYTATKDKYSDGNPSILTPATIITKNNEEVTSILGNIGYNGLLELLEKNNVIIKK